MKSSPVSPGELCGSKTGGKHERLFLIASVHLAGQRQQSLKRFTGTTPSAHITVVEAIGGDWRMPGEILVIPLTAFTDEAPAFWLVPRRGPPIEYMPGTSDTVQTRLQRSHANLKDTGGARRTISFSAEAIDALKQIKSIRQISTAEKLDDTKVVNTLIMEEHERINASKK